MALSAPHVAIGHGRTSVGKSSPPRPLSDSPAAVSDRALIKANLDEEEARLRRLEIEHEEARKRLAELRKGLAVLDESPPQPQDRGSSVPAPLSSLEKVRLFRQLFRGREDLYPTRFVSKKTGKPGYTPACSNKFVAGVCELPKVKCGDCANQAFRPVDDGAVLRHLQGKHACPIS